MTTDAGNHPRRETGKRLKWWAVAGALLVIGILPCPECGTPLALHIWPLLPLFAAIRMAARRFRASDGGTATNNPSDSVVASGRAEGNLTSPNERG